MKKSILLALLFSFISTKGFNQGTAPNWTVDDCSAVSHSLYNYLDSQEVVVMEFAMGCGSCTQAAGYLMNLKSQYAVSHPGKVNWFYMDYWASNNCTNVIATAAPYAFDAVFAGCMPQKNDYYPSISPMPAIVIAAGNYHTVIYQSLTWYNADTALIKAAIDQFFVTVGMENGNDKDILLYPNPAKEKLFVNVASNVVSDVEVFDIYGKSIHADYKIEGEMIVVDIEHLPAGKYVLVVKGSNVLRTSFIRL